MGKRNTNKTIHGRMKFAFPVQIQQEKNELNRKIVQTNNKPLLCCTINEMIINFQTSSFIMLDSLAADQAFVIININAESSSFFSARASIFLQAASTVGELTISLNFSSAAFRASMLCDALSYACTAAKQTFPSLARSVEGNQLLVISVDAKNCPEKEEQYNFISIQ